MVVGFVGFPRSGKSTYIYQHLYPCLLKKQIRFFIQAANPDGEGVWTFESPSGKMLRRKMSFDHEFVSFVVNSVINLSRFFPLVILDCGGKISRENVVILSHCDAVVVVWRTEEELHQWVKFLYEIKPFPIFPVHSTWDGEKMVYDKDPEDFLQFVSSITS